MFWAVWSLIVIQFVVSPGSAFAPLICVWIQFEKYFLLGVKLMCYYLLYMRYEGNKSNL